MSYRRGNTVAQLNERLKPAINVQGMLYTTRAALPHLLQAAEVGSRRVGDIVNISSIAGRVA
jgi:NADP-dependent 3-hydroxy acid dehydrogenase YdfG